ncbi:ParA family protein [Anaerosalibacter sp. Marseille-P3206]
MELKFNGLFFITQKGGRKTTTALNLGYALSEEGKEVILIDFVYK